MSEALTDLVSRQKKILMLDGVSGKSQKKSHFHKLMTNDDPGLKDIFSE
jgi:hypothetical protein